MDVKEYKTANSWYSSMRGQGYDVPVTLLQLIEKTMKSDKQTTFAEVFEELENKNRITITGKKISFK